VRRKRLNATALVLPATAARADISSGKVRVIDSMTNNACR